MQASQAEDHPVTTEQLYDPFSSEMRRPLLACDVVRSTLHSESTTVPFHFVHGAHALLCCRRVKLPISSPRATAAHVPSPRSYISNSIVSSPCPRLSLHLLSLPQHQQTGFLDPDVSDRIALSFLKELLNKRTKRSKFKKRKNGTKSKGSRKLVCWC